MQACISTCDQNQVYLAQFYRIINEENSPEVYATAQNSQYYVGAVHEDEVGNGEKLIELLTMDNPDAFEGIQKGARNICLEGWTVGDATFQQRWTGYQNGVKAWNDAHPDDPVSMTDPVYANTSSSEGAKVTQQFVNNYPDMDALIVAGGGGDPLVGSIGQLANMGLTGTIRVASTDFLEDLKEQLETGGMYAESGGHFCDPALRVPSRLQCHPSEGGLRSRAGRLRQGHPVPVRLRVLRGEYENYEKYFVEDDPVQRRGDRRARRDELR